jgi:hypothetical protein
MKLRTIHYCFLGFGLFAEVTTRLCDPDPKNFLFLAVNFAYAFSAVYCMMGFRRTWKTRFRWSAVGAVLILGMSMLKWSSKISLIADNTACIIILAIAFGLVMIIPPATSRSKAVGVAG